MPPPSTPACRAECSGTSAPPPRAASLLNVRDSPPKVGYAGAMAEQQLTRTDFRRTAWRTFPPSTSPTGGSGRSHHRMCARIAAEDPPRLIPIGARNGTGCSAPTPPRRSRQRTSQRFGRLQTADYDPIYRFHMPSDKRGRGPGNEVGGDRTGTAWSVSCGWALRHCRRLGQLAVWRLHGYGGGISCRSGMRRPGPARRQATAPGRYLLDTIKGAFPRRQGSGPGGRIRPRLQLRYNRSCYEAWLSAGPTALPWRLSASSTQ